MSQGLVSKLKTWMSGDPFDEELYGDENYEYASADASMMDATSTAMKEKRHLKVVGHPSSSNYASSTQVVVTEPRSFDEALDIIEHLKTKKAVILNLHLLDSMQSQRIVDFLSGATHAIEGHQQRVGDGVFIFTPNNVGVVSEASKGLGFSGGFWNE